MHKSFCIFDHSWSILIKLGSLQNLWWCLPIFSLQVFNVLRMEAGKRSKTGEIGSGSQCHRNLGKKITYSHTIIWIIWIIYCKVLRDEQMNNGSIVGAFARSIHHSINISHFAIARVTCIQNDQRKALKQTCLSAKCQARQHVWT